MASPVYLADTSVFALQAQHLGIAERYNALVVQGRLAACQMSAMEYLNNAPDPRQYEEIHRALQGHRWMDVTTDSMDRALAVHRELASHSQHRSFSLPDLIIAATAEQHGATVLHYDADYDRIAEITGQPTEWIVDRGSL
ncbi:MAG TPA: PIN domain nuclease [Jatrophihabitantaceae bacterium]|jgi:hypothetical protein